MLRAARLPLVLAMAALALLLAALETARPGYFLHDDNATWFAGAYAHDYRVLTETGRFAEVNFFQYGGEPFLEQGQTAVLYPPVYVAEFFAVTLNHDERRAIEWLAVLHLAFGLVGFYWWARQSGARGELAALGGLAWVLNPFVLILSASWIMVTAVAAWLPWTFWALDRLMAKPTTVSALALGTILGFFFLQGYVQWCVYALIFAAIYASLQLVLQRQTPRVPVLYHLVLAALVFFAWAAPLLLPMMHAVAFSAARGQPLAWEQVLYYRLQPDDFVRAQIGLFRPGFLFGLSSAIFFCPAFVAALIFLRFFRATMETRRRLFPLLMVAALAFLFSTRWHVLLNALPLLEKFRWPFKVFLFAEFFVLAALVMSWSARPRRSVFLHPIVLVLLLELIVALTQHDGNFISKTILPNRDRPLPATVDPARGRVLALDDHLPELNCSRFFTHAYGTYFEVPSLGGYDPLVGRAQLDFALGLDFPNLLTAPITPELRANLEDRAVRYWLVDPASPQNAEVEKLAGLELIDAQPDRLIYEDQQARPIAADANSHALRSAYRGNSLEIDLDHAASPVTVRIGPTDGWWYRQDQGKWGQAEAGLGGLIIPVAVESRRLEVSYFDARFRQGLILSALVSMIATLMIAFGSRRMIRS